MDIQTLATKCQDYLQRKTRENGEIFVHTIESAPEWFSDMVYDCHDGLMPNDWSYFAIESAIDDLAGGCEYASPDTSRSRSWFYEFAYSEDFCDEQVTMTHNETIGQVIEKGMWAHFDQVFYQVQTALEEQIEEMESDDAD